MRVEQRQLGMPRDDGLRAPRGGDHRQLREGGRAKLVVAVAPVRHHLPPARRHGLAPLPRVRQGPQLLRARAQERGRLIRAQAQADGASESETTGSDTKESDFTEAEVVDEDSDVVAEAETILEDEVSEKVASDKSGPH